jgi:GTPase Era involved in 16S rRNA processing
MADIIERKQKLFDVMDGYTVLLERWNDKSRKSELVSARSAIQRGRYQLALIGFVKRGKSTLLNALLGDAENPAIAPARNDTCTAAIVKYLDSALYPEAPGREGAIVYFNDGRNPEYIEKADISRYVDQQNADFIKDAADRIDCIEIYGNFPLVETRGVIVDTPGRGALYDQDYLTTGILPEVDVIICPISADYPLDRGEMDFLIKLPPGEKKKLLFVLTKTDDVDSDELKGTIANTQNTISAIAGGSPRLFKTAAKKLVDARKAGKTAKEIEAVKITCGIKELETALDVKLRAGSYLDEQIRTWCEVLEDYFTTDKKRLTEDKENLSRDAVKLEQEKKDLEMVLKTTKDSFKKNAGELKKKWSQEITKFTNKLSFKEGMISDRLTGAVEKENLITLIGYSSKLQRKIQAVLQQELTSDLADMNDTLDALVKNFAEKLQSDYDSEIAVYSRTSGDSGINGEINTLIGGGIAVGGGLWGATTALGALSTIGTAATGLATAGAATAATVANAGVAGSFLSKLFGVGKVASAVSAGTLAQGGLVSALIVGVVPIVGGIVVTSLAYRFGTNFAKNRTVKNIPVMVKNQINESIQSIEDSAQKMLDAVLLQFEERINETFEQKQENLDSIIESLKSLNKEAKLQEIERDLQEIGKLSTALNDVG